jgi:hypothetical protein
MNVVLLIESKMYPVPKKIEIVTNWGPLTLVDKDGHPIATGEHIYLKGEQEDFVRWLARFDGVYVGRGAPMEQTFKFLKVAEELRNTFQTPKIKTKEGKC